MRHRALVAAATAAALLGAAGCGGAPDKLDSDDDRALLAAREGLDDAFDTEEAIRTSPALARRLAAQAERAQGAPRELERLVPSLVDGSKVDGHALSAFVRYAESDAPRALLLPAQAEVGRIVEVIDDSGADGDTKVPHDRNRRLGRLVAELERDVSAVWPSLSKQLKEAL